MRRIITFTVAFCFMLLSACSTTVNRDAAIDSRINAGKKRLKIAATIFPPFDFAKAISKDKAEVKMLMPTGAESHDYEPTLQNIDAVSRCDIFIYVGGSADKWAKKLLDAVPNNTRTVICLTEEVPTLKIDGSEHSHSHSHDHDDEIDEHVWTDPKNVETIVEKIAEILCEKDSENTSVYIENLEAYKKELTKLDNDIKNTVAAAKYNVLAFADKFPFRYLANAYKLNYVSALDGCDSDTEPTLAAVQEVINTIEKYGLSFVIYTEDSSGDIAESISKMTGAEPRLLYSCHNISRSQLESGETYISLMNKNISVLKEALN